MNRFLSIGLLVGLLCATAEAATVPYGKPVELVGKLTEQPGVECCAADKARQVKVPALVLEQAIDVASGTGPSTADDDPERNIRLLQLVLTSDALWGQYQASKGQRVRATCSLFHGFSGHHLTPVLCVVKGMVRLDRP